MEKNKQFSNGTGLNRREFISFAGTAAAGFIVTGAKMPVMAGPFGNDYLKYKSRVGRWLGRRSRTRFLNA